MKWISVKDKLPEFEAEVIVYVKNQGIFFGAYADKVWWRTYTKISGQVTHWMPLPEPPK